MIWLLRDFDLLSVLLRAASLSLEAFTLGGLLFLLFVAGPLSVEDQSAASARSITRGFALAFAAAQVASVALSIAILMGGSGFPFRALVSANFFVAGTAATVAALLLYAMLRSASRSALYASLLPGVAVLAAAVAQSHAASRMEDRPLLLVLTAMHHLGAAGWVGAMLSLLVALRRSTSFAAAQALARRYSTMAIVSVLAIVGAGIGLSWFYVGSWTGLYGTTYGILIIAKSYLVLVMLTLAAGNFRLLRAAAPAGGQPSVGTGFLLRLRRFSEAELGLGLTAVLAAASLTSQPPAIDLQQDQLSLQEIVARTRWETPRLHSPALAQLAPPTNMARALQDSKYSIGWVNDANDRAWSEYNHHWAGLIVLFAGLLAFAANTLPRGRARSLASNWPLFFLGLAVFIILRADPENWPLGPRPFWQSFASPDVLEHRLFAVLISCFAFFEWAVATGRWRSQRAAYVFPLLCAAGGAVLLTHSHGLSNVKDETLADLTHTSIAVMGATAGWCRWLQLRLPGTRSSQVAGYIWPVCLAVAGLLLLDYREA